MQKDMFSMAVKFKVYLLCIYHDIKIEIWSLKFELEHEFEIESISETRASHKSEHCLDVKNKYKTFIWAQV